MKYTATIGLEIHAELNTETKMFCDCLNDDQEIEPNINICPVCTGHPGALPKANKKAIEMVIKTGLALNCSINRFSKFDRKNYFYPDLPKGYQISQYDLPLCENGTLELPSGFIAKIKRIHLEEDTAKLLHPEGMEKQYSLADFNRAGVPLMELVTEPCFHSAEEVVEFAKEFRLILRYLNVSDADMEKGHLRLEANISVAPENFENLGTKVEVKNLNSFNSVYLAVKYEIDRQIKELENGKEIVQETRGWDENNKKTFSQRSKESAQDYRYFPEPDIPPLRFEEGYIDNLKSLISELPQQRRSRLSKEYNLSKEQAELLVEDIIYCDFFEKAVSELGAMVDHPDTILVFNYLTSDIRGMEKEIGTSLLNSKITPHMLAHTIAFLQEDKISSRAAKDAIREAFVNGIDPERYIEENQLVKISNTYEIEKLVKEVVDENKNVWEDYIGGKESAIQFLIGAVMRKSQGKADPKIVSDVIRKLKDAID